VHACLAARLACLAATLRHAEAPVLPKGLVLHAGHVFE